MGVGKIKPITEKIENAILFGTANCLGMEEICKPDDMPCTTTVYKYLNENPEFAEKYARAKGDMCERMADEILKIADCDDNDYGYKDTGDGDAKPFILKENVNRDRLRVDTRKWLMSKLKPKKYGDLLKLGGDSEAPIVLQITPNDTKL